MAGTTARADARWKIAVTAFEMEGSHYLNGAKGARPNKKDGAPVRPGSVALEMNTALPSLAFFAASLMLTKKDATGKSSPDKHVCGGMYEALGGTQASDNDVILKNYLAQQNPKNPAKCWTKAGFTPRRLAGSHDKKNTGRIVWGESCDGWRHFDCIGLVEFAVQQAVKITIGGEIWQFASPKNVLHAKPIHDDTDIMNGDLVSQLNSDGVYHHIGVVYLVDGGGAMIAQAVETSRGVTVGTAYNRSSWSGGRWRLPDSLLKPDNEISEDIPDSKYRPTIPVPQYD